MHPVAIESVTDNPNGQALVALADGSKILVSRDVARVIRTNKVPGPSHSSRSARVQPVNVIPANCGSSYLFLYETSEGVLMRTGFDVRFPAFGYAWGAQVQNLSTGRTGGYEASGGLRARRQWNGSKNFKFDAGTYYGSVLASQSYAYGATHFCTSGGPWDSIESYAQGPN
jgi:hypothetical protein